MTPDAQQLPLPAPPAESVQIVIREPGGRVMHLNVAPVLIPLLVKAGWKIVEEENEFSVYFP